MNEDSETIVITDNGFYVQVVCGGCLSRDIALLEVRQVVKYDRYHVGMSVETYHFECNFCGVHFLKTGLGKRER